MPLVRIATRGSKLALAQAHWVAQRLKELEKDLEVQLVVVKTTGDRILDRPLATVGGKGLFVKEVEQALLEHRADVAVHSMKDLPAELAEGLVIGAVPERADPRDVLVGLGGAGLGGLENGVRVGTSSLRRRAQLKHVCPGLEVVPVRGNVDTRLRKWREGQVDGLMLAAAGLKRLGIAPPEAAVLVPEQFVPAAGQGLLAVEVREDDGPVRSLVERLNHEPSAAAAAAERGMLAELGGGCHVPVGAYAQVEGESLHIIGMVAGADGKPMFRAALSGATEDAHALGRALGQELKRMGAEQVLAQAGGW